MLAGRKDCRDAAAAIPTLIAIFRMAH